jgi:hypothetical protein
MLDTSSYTRQTGMTAAGPHEAQLKALPSDPGALAGILHGLVVHEFMAGGYGFTLSDESRATVHVRPAADLLTAIVTRDPRPLYVPRTPESRLAGNCRHFTVLMAAMLRVHGIPARARCGFGAYFGTGVNEDHWVCEYLDDGRWTLIDAQIDETQLQWFPIEFDVLDVPRDQFLVAGEAWRRFRSGEADPDTFGLSAVHEAGDWWIAANLMRDGAALLNTELLPWDCWGAMPRPEDPISDDLAALFDELAAATLDPDPAVLAKLYSDDRLRVPPTVRNAARGGYEPVWPAGADALPAGVSMSRRAPRPAR